MRLILQKLTLISLATALLIVPACAQTKHFVSAEGRFSVNLHATPSEDKNSGEAKAGGNKLWWRSDQATFAIGWADNPDAKKENAERAAEAAGDGYISTLPKAAEVISRKKIVLDGYPGVEITSREKDGFTVTARYFSVDTRFYSLMAMWDDRSNDSYVLKILDSFKLQAQPEPTPKPA